MWPFRKKRQEEETLETRATASGFTAHAMAARESYVSGRRGLGELTATVQTCISLWEHGLSVADVEGTDLFPPAVLGLAARALALRGEAVFLVRDERLVACSDWDLRTRDGQPVAYRVSVSEAGGGTTQTALAGEVCHFRIGSDVSAPWTGSAPLRRASLTGELLHALESALVDVFENAPLGSQIVPFPESPGTDLERLGRGFRGRRGSVLLRESVNVTAAGGPAPSADWRPNSLTPDLEKSLAIDALEAARSAILGAFGVLPALMNRSATGPVIREAQRHLASWALQPIAHVMAAEATEKLGAPVSIDVMRPLQAFDAGGRARALGAIVSAVATAKQSGVTPEELASAFKLVDWSGSGE